MELTREGRVGVLTMDAGENRFNPETLGRINELLDEVEGSEDTAALVLTGTGKFFSNGLDLEWMGQAPEGGAVAAAEGSMELMARVLAFPVPTVAAINGHCFAAGAMVALACDLRVMRADRGFFCLPEVDINMQFTPGMQALICSRLDHQAAHEAMLGGHRYGGEDAFANGIVQAAVPEERVLPHAIELADGMAGKNRDTVAQMKRSLYADAIEKLALPLFA